MLIELPCQDATLTAYFLKGNLVILAAKWINVLESWDVKVHLMDFKQVILFPDLEGLLPSVGVGFGHVDDHF